MAENAVNTEQGVILEALNNKVDLNQLNTNNQGLSYVSGLGMPSDKYIDLTLGASGTTYTAPANGWVLFTANGNGYISLQQRMFSVNSMGTTSGGNWYSAVLPVTKGQFYANYTGITKQIFRFFYAQGESEE